MDIGYMTNAWGEIIGNPAGVSSIKELFYFSTGADEESIALIAKAGFSKIELFDGNLMQYQENPNRLSQVLKQNVVSLLAVYTGANYIYNDIFYDESKRMERTAQLAAKLGAKHIVFGGGAIRTDKSLPQDLELLAKKLDELHDMAKSYNLIGSYHPHLGTIAQNPDQIHQLMSLTKINLCPDTGHIEAGGGDSLAIIKKYISRIHYIHLKDYADGSFLPLGEGGLIDFKEIIRFVRAEKPTVDFTVEADGYEGDPNKALILSHNFLETCIN